MFYTRRFLLLRPQLSQKATDDRNIIGCESGDQVLQIYEKTRG